MEFMDVETLRHKIKVLYVLDDVMISPKDDDDLRLVRHKTTELYEAYFLNNTPLAVKNHCIKSTFSDTNGILMKMRVI